MEREDIKLSLCMIVKDEAGNLSRCLNSVRGVADEIIIVDTGSTDNTKKIALTYTEKVYDFEWIEDFAAARNYAASFATGDWILTLDADDEMEQEDIVLLLELIKNNSVEAYFFPTISYVGEERGLDTVINMNLRLYKNNKDYKYTGRIHEQLASNIIKINPKARMESKNVRIYHYGYISKEVSTKGKRTRNKKILDLMLEESKEDAFVLFNMGNEYFASNNYNCALDFYRRALQNLPVNCGYESKLLLRIILCLIDLKEFQEGLEVIEDGLKKFPRQTDYLFLKGIIYKTQLQYDKAIKCFQGCLELGEAPIQLRFVEGVGSYKSHYCLGDIYYDMNKFDLAFEAYGAAVSYTISYEIALEKLIGTALRLTSIDKAAKMLEGIIDLSNPNNLYHLSKAYYKLKQYPLAQYYIERAAANDNNMHIIKLQSKIYFYRGDFENSRGLLAKLWFKEDYDFELLQLYLLSNLLMDQYNGIDRMLAMIKEKGENEYFYQIYCAFVSLLLGVEQKHHLSDDPIISVEYSNRIFELLKLLLEVRAFNYFDKAIRLLNLVNDNNVLLRLGKLYYLMGYEILAEREISRSMKLFNVCDEEGQRILKKIYKDEGNKK